MKDIEFAPKEEIASLAFLVDKDGGMLSLYIPATAKIDEVIHGVTEERNKIAGISEKIELENKMLIALENLVAYLEQFKEIPSNGLVVFSGRNPRINTFKEKKNVWGIVPEKKNLLNFYRCERFFVLKPLNTLMGMKEN